MTVTQQVNSCSWKIRLRKPPPTVGLCISSVMCLQEVRCLECLQANLDYGDDDNSVNKKCFRSEKGGLISVMDRRPFEANMRDDFNDKFMKLYVDYSAVIKSSIFGHGHTDSFHVVKASRHLNSARFSPFQDLQTVVLFSFSA